MSQELATIEDVTVIRETSIGEKNLGAILCLVDEKEVWIPKAAIDVDSEVYRFGTEGALVISERLATEKGIV